MLKNRKFIALILTGCMVCLANACSPSYPECYEDTDCTTENNHKSYDEYCLNAKCAECRNDEHCSSKKDESYICNSGTCQRINGYCNPDAGINCPAGQKCRDRRCGPECYPETVEEDCAADQICENNRCTAKPECLSDADCPSGKICRNKKCVDAPVCQPSLAYFDFDEATIRSDAKSTIEENAQCLNSRSDVSSVQVVGHCDERGTEEYNMALGKRRADAVKKVLDRFGVKHVSAKSRGAMDPVVSGAFSESEHQRNRRAEFLVNP